MTRKKTYKQGFATRPIPDNPANLFMFIIRTARIAILILLEYYDVMHTKSLRTRIAPEFSDVMTT